MNLKSAHLHWLWLPVLLVALLLIQWSSTATPVTSAIESQSSLLASGQGSMIGLITDSVTGKRLVGVTVSVDGQTTLTDAVGIYQFDNVTEGLQVVVASFPNYLPAQKSRVVVNGELVWNSIVMTPKIESTATASPTAFPTATPVPTAGTGTLIGVITNADNGQAIAGVGVSANGQVVSTDSRGIYIFLGLPPGEQLVSAQHPDFQPAAKVGFVVADTTRWNSFAMAPVPTPAPTDTATATEPPIPSPTATATNTPIPTATDEAPSEPGSLMGLITNIKTGERLAGVVVSTDGRSIQTQDNGFYLFENLAPGSYVVSAGHPDFQPAQQTGFVVSNEARWNSIALTPLEQPTATTTPTIPPSPTTTATPIPTATSLPPATPTPTPTVPPSPTGTATTLPTATPTATSLPSATPTQTQTAPPSPTATPASPCLTSSEATFDLIPIQNPASQPRPDYLHGDLNLAQRGYAPTDAPLSLQDYDGDADPNAPQLAGLFEPNNFPGISAVYRVNHWDWSCGEHGCRGGPITDWPVTLLGLSTTPGQAIYIPERMPEIFGGEFKAMVLYAEEQRITLGYTRDDTVASGYTVHIENVCVDPNLLALYRAQIDEAGFRATNLLPALRNNQKLGTALGDEIQVAVRDRGAFMDPRSRKDWWQ